MENPMKNDTDKPQVFDTLVPAAVTVVHHYVSELHGAAADAACAIAGAHVPEGSLLGRRTVHVGAGFGADTRTAALWGATPIGLEMSEDQVAFARILDEGTDDAVRAAITGDPVVRALYPEPVVEAALREVLRERRELALVREGPARALVRRCDVLRDDLRVAAGGQAHAVIGNIMLHWSKLGGAPLARALDRFATVLAPRGAAVFTVPWHFVASSDPADDARRRAQTVSGTALYRRATELFRARLEARGAVAFATDAARLVKDLVIHDDEARAGSESMELVQVHTRVFAPHRAPAADVLRGQMVYEATFFTGRPASELAGDLAHAIDEATRAGDIDATAATYVRFYVYRRRS